MTGATEPRIPLPTDPSVPKYGTPIDYAVADFAAAAVRSDRLDPVLTELVRLRCGRVHDCRLCRSLRTVSADELDEATAAKIDHYESSDLPERAKVALRLTDAVILDPAGAGPELRAAASERFSPPRRDATRTASTGTTTSRAWRSTARSRSTTRPGTCCRFRNPLRRDRRHGCDHGRRRRRWTRVWSTFSRPSRRSWVTTGVGL